MKQFSRKGDLKVWGESQGCVKCGVLKVWGGGSPGDVKCGDLKVCGEAQVM